MTAVNAVTASASVRNPSSRSTTVRCPVLDTGRNSVSPSTTPRRPACSKFTTTLLRRGRWVRRRASARGHADGAVQTDDLAVEVTILDDLPRQRGVLRRVSQPGRVRDLL